ncbi:MAG: PorT family protein [Bacteroidetes bacterium]|nr:PorT family protein [Bacteroidota bacterium]MBL6944260.1 PorT family protein [Bacteroidales bacterium]
MKKLSLLISAILIITSVQAQFHFGPQVGYTASKLTTDKSDIKTSFKNNFLFGAFVRLGDKFYVQPEVNWLTQGGIWEDETSNEKLEMTYKTIQIPVNVGLKAIDLKLVNVRLLGGISANIAVDKDIKINNISEPIKEAEWKDVVWQYQLGAGIDVLMLALDIKYVGGLNNLSKDDFTFQGNTITTKSNMFMVTLGWKIF